LPTINSQIVLVEPAKYDIPEYNSQIQIVPGDGFSHFDGSSFKNNVWFFGKSEGNCLDYSDGWITVKNALIK